MAAYPRRISLLLALAGALHPVRGEADEGRDVLRLGELPDDTTLARLLWERSPDLVAPRGRVATARSEVLRAGLIPNPGVDLSWNTIPVGKTNPPGLDPLADVPNYAVSLSQLVEIGKRGPRRRAAAGALDASVAEAEEALRQRFFDLLEEIAEAASAELRLAALDGLVLDATRLTEIQRQRVLRGETSGLDGDRARLEEEKLRATLAGERRRLQTALLECGRLVSMPCEPFGDRDRAARFLGRTLWMETARIDDRPDLRALAAVERSARASLDLGRRRAVPDPTVQLGYVHDRFIVSGNQAHSLFVAVSLPVPLFDHGQADVAAARAAIETSSRARTLLRAEAERALPRLADQRRDVVLRRGRLSSETLPLARSIVERLEAAVARGAAPLQDLLLARRTLGELLLDEADLSLEVLRIDATLARTAGAAPPLPR